MKRLRVRGIPTLLRTWRVVKLSLISLLSYLLHTAMQWIMVSPFNELDSAVQSIVISSIIISIIAGLFKIVEKIDQPIEEDKV